MSDDRDWRDACKPNWARDAAEEEIGKLRLKAALRWPDESRPIHVPFIWGERDKLIGIPVPGTYYRHDYNGRVERVEIRERRAGDSGFRKWIFNGSDHVVRGPLYYTEKDAALAALWHACEESAEKLENLWRRYELTPC